MQHAESHLDHIRLSELITFKILVDQMLSVCF